MSLRAHLKSVHSFFDNPLGGGGMVDSYWNYCQNSDGVLYYTDLRPTEERGQLYE